MAKRKKGRINWEGKKLLVAEAKFVIISSWLINFLLHGFEQKNITRKDLKLSHKTLSTYSLVFHVEDK